MGKVFRHGDIIFREVEKLPAGKIKSITNRFEQHGETGKLHVVENVEVTEIDWDKYLRTLQDEAEVTHPEHPILKLPSNTLFKVERVRSVTPIQD